MNTRRKTYYLAGIAVLALLLAVPTYGDSITIDGTGSFSEDGYNFDLSAQAVFDLTGNTLTVLLCNTSVNAINIPSEVLTAVLFDISAGHSLTPETARLDSGASVLYPPTYDADGNLIVSDIPGTYGTGANAGDVSSEWAYKDGWGISSSGLDDLFGGKDRFSELGDLQNTDGDLEKPASPDGLQYGLLPEWVTEADLVGTNLGDGKDALISGCVLFTLTTSNGFALDDIDFSTLSFQYGTSMSQPNIPPIPEPATCTLFGLGLAALAVQRRKRR